ncbi:alpha-tocopherol transfer protein-like [Sabethes cyaneus]|uniref:alpha-tocopherol transfer protein-like n=1 Tax=Sabethes cyaneus TaxID=53552 RepID=UPI00237EA36E|nr:alpha-tocopherol transfer protein-like [Sabethes cyaneus]
MGLFGWFDTTMPEIAVLQPSTTLPASNSGGGKITLKCKSLAETNVGQPKKPLFADDEKKTAKINELRALVENCDDFVRRSDDLFLSRFLICCDWDVQEAFQRMVKLFKLKHDNPEWFINEPLNSYKHILKRNVKFVLDKRDKNGRRIFVTKMCNMNINESSATDLAHLDELWCEFMLNDLETQQNGIACLLDMSGFSIKSLRYLTPSNIKIGTQKADLLPVKHMEFHVVNSSAFLNTAVAILYPVLSKQIKDKVHFHYSDWDSLHAALGKEALPAVYGGTNGTDLDCESLNNQLLQLEDHYNSLVRFGYELKPHVDSSKYAKYFHNIDVAKRNKKHRRSRIESEVVEQ